MEITQKLGARNIWKILDDAHSKKMSFFMICALNAGSIFTATFFCPIFTISREMKIVRAQNLGGIYLGIGFFWAPLF